MENMKVKGPWTMLWLSYLALIGCFLPYIGYSTKITQIMEDTSISYAQTGMLASVTALVGGLTLPFVGVLVDKWGARNIILWGLLISAVGQILFAYMPSYSTLVFSRALIGLGVGLLFVGPYTMAAQWFEKSNGVGSAMGVMFTSDGIGTVFSLYLFSYILIAIGWRNGSAIGGIFLVAIFIISFFLLKNPPHITDRQNTAKESGEKFNLKDYLKVIGDRNVIVASAFFIGEWGLYAVIAYWVPTILIEDAGWSEGLAGFLTSLYVLVGIVPSIILGLVSDRMGKRKPFIILAGLWMTLTLIILTIALANGNYGLVAFMMPLVGIGVYSGMPVALASAVESVGTKFVATANGFILGIGFLVGGFLYPYIMGYIKDATGAYTIGFISIIVATFVLNFVAAFLSKDPKKGESLKTTDDVVIQS
ncbi:putative sulfoacetate transporter SauU [Neobacillus rhizosphaerae]|uniref:Sulfoacetate transporter SauU n=1 Tax=Neobacillus rhizosphaerae TaxID=2880965 RepID=A0ABM9ER95_9BACI|nr:MFS transporter [Neobacillus rhizosphaerae]CAH2715175.1 putative sulfoacetate transporter SauU [Neobacillus rhizosphaerae]